MTSPQSSLESQVLRVLAERGEITDSEAFCAEFDRRFDHKSVVGTLRSLEASEMVCLEVWAYATVQRSLSSAVRSQADWESHL